MIIHFHRDQRTLFLATPIWLALELWLGFVFPRITHGEEIAILKSADIGAYTEAIDAFKDALPPSLQITVEYNLQGDMAKGRSLARRIRASDANVVLAVGLKAALAAKLEILDIPVVMCLVLNPEKYALPSSNMVGLSLHIPFATQVKPLQRLVPQISRIGVLFDPDKTQDLRDRLQQEAHNQGMTLISEEVRDEKEVSNALKSLHNNIDALWLLPDSTVLTENTLDFLLSTALETNIPVMAFSAGLVESGALTGVYFHYKDLGEQAASLTAKMLTPAASSLVGRMVPPNIVHKSINMKSARYLGLPISPETLEAFDEHY